MAYAVQDRNKVEETRTPLYERSDAASSGPCDVYMLARQTGAGPLGGVLKRALDIIVALVALIVFAPLMIALASVIWIQGDGPVFYRQKRIGYEGRSFDCLKFRSMVVNSQECLAQFLASNPLAREEWSATHKLRNDPRITPLGRFLRKSSLDELPQLFNILCGDMSVVGPRPIVAAEVVHYDHSFAFYMQSRPGLTGLWQISGRSETSYVERVTLDVKYVTGWSFLEDVTIMLKTVPAVLSSRGSY